MSMVMGRPNKGVGHIDNCEGSEQSKERARVILQTISGELSVQEACDLLGIQRPRFAELRALALQGSVDAIEPGRPGRPRKRDVDEERRERELLARIEELERDVQIARTKEMLAELNAAETQAAEKGGDARSQWEPRVRPKAPKKHGRRSR